MFSWQGGDSDSCAYGSVEICDQDSCPDDMVGILTVVFIAGWGF